MPNNSNSSTPRQGRPGTLLTLAAFALSAGALAAVPANLDLSVTLIVVLIPTAAAAYLRANVGGDLY